MTTNERPTRVDRQSPLSGALFIFETRRQKHRSPAPSGVLSGEQPGESSQTRRSGPPARLDVEHRDRFVALAVGGLKTDDPVAVDRVARSVGQAIDPNGEPSGLIRVTGERRLVHASGRRERTSVNRPPLSCLAHGSRILDHESRQVSASLCRENCEVRGARRVVPQAFFTLFPSGLAIALAQVVDRVYPPQRAGGRFQGSNGAGHEGSVSSIRIGETEA